LPVIEMTITEVKMLRHKKTCLRHSRKTVTKTGSL
jgi:hypothetical protein